MVRIFYFFSQFQLIHFDSSNIFFFFNLFIKLIHCLPRKKINCVKSAQNHNTNWIEMKIVANNVRAVVL